MGIINYFKRQRITDNDTTYFDKCYSIQYNNNNEDSSTIMEKYSCGPFSLSHKEPVIGPKANPKLFLMSYA